MLKSETFDCKDSLLHFVAENNIEQCAILRQSDTVWELAYMQEQEDQPTQA